MWKYQLLFLALFISSNASIKEGQSLADYLWEQTQEYQKQALNANLIYGMREKCLDPSEFGGYMVDDAYYLYEGAVSFEIAGQQDISVDLHQFLDKEAKDWTGYWEWLNKIWHIKSVDGLRPGDAVTTYVNHIRSVAETETPIYTVLAFTPCAKLWPWLGKQIGSGTNNFGVYTSWVETNLDPTSTGYLEYEAQVQQAYENGEVTVEKALEIFTESMKNEVAFFSSVARCEPSADTTAGAKSLSL